MLDASLFPASDSSRLFRYETHQSRLIREVDWGYVLQLWWADGVDRSWPICTLQQHILLDTAMDEAANDHVLVEWNRSSDEKAPRSDGSVGSNLINLMCALFWRLTKCNGWNIHPVPINIRCANCNQLHVATCKPVISNQLNSSAECRKSNSTCRVLLTTAGRLKVKTGTGLLCLIH